MDRGATFLSNRVRGAAVVSLQPGQSGPDQLCCPGTSRCTNPDLSFPCYGMGALGVPPISQIRSRRTDRSARTGVHGRSTHGPLPFMRALFKEREDNMTSLVVKAIVAGMLVVTTGMGAQSPSPTTYDVSTVKPAAPGNGGGETLSLLPAKYLRISHLGSYVITCNSLCPVVGDAGWRKYRKTATA